MKAIGINMVELQPMNGGQARMKGYEVPENYGNVESGYEITYPDGYKSWSPKDIADAAYFQLADESGDIIKPEDIDNLITDCYSVKVGAKTTNTTIVTKTGFEVHGQSGCVKAENFDLAIGEQYAKPKALDQLWFAMGFVLQWAKYGLKECIGNKYPRSIQLLIDENNQLVERSVKLAHLINNDPTFRSLPIEEQEAIKEQLVHMNKYSNVLADRLLRAGVKLTKY